MDNMTGADAWSLIAPILAPYNDPVMTSAYVIKYCALKEYDEGRNLIKDDRQRENS